MAHAPPGSVAGAAAWGAGEPGILPAVLVDASGWHWRPEVVVPLALLAALYVAGWVRLRARAPRAAPAWRLAAHMAGVAALVLALVSPIDGLASVSFAVHMGQHVLLLMVAAPLLLLADPLAVVLWALPRRARRSVGNLLRAGGLRTVWRAVISPPVAWLGSALTVWLWHLPAAYDAALGSRPLHDLEHLAFFAAGLLFWWPVVNPAPRLRRPVHAGLRVVYLVLGGLQKATLGLLITLAPTRVTRRLPGSSRRARSRTRPGAASSC